MSKQDNIFIAVLIGALLLFLLADRGCKYQPCGEAKIKIDTLTQVVYVHDTIPIEIPLGKPHLYKVAKRQSSTHVVDDMLADMIGGITVPVKIKTELAQCLDTNTYLTRHYEPNKYNIALYDTVTGNKLIGHSLFFKDLTPDTVRTVEKTVTIVKKPPLVGIWLGASAALNPLRYDVSPAVSLSIANRVNVGYSYSILHPSHNVSLMFNIWPK
jgi:hypothetical protein